VSAHSTITPKRKEPKQLICKEGEEEEAEKDGGINVDSIYFLDAYMEGAAHIPMCAFLSAACLPNRGVLLLWCRPVPLLHNPLPAPLGRVLPEAVASLHALHRPPCLLLPPHP